MNDPTPTLGTLLGELIQQIAAAVAAELPATPAGDQAEERSPWLSLASAAHYLDWPKQRLYKLTAAGAIPHYKHDGRLLFHRHELDHWLRDYHQPLKPLAWPPEQSYS
jgi:excisionase family DNA binding protein